MKRTAITIVGTCVFLAASSIYAQTNQGENGTAVASRIPTSSTTPQTNEHPLVPVINWAKNGRPEIAKIKDYTAILTKQENIDGVIQDAQVMDIKVRHEPFSVYLKFRYPKVDAGKEVIYIEGQNDGKLLAHGVGLQKAAGTLKLDPLGMLAMKGNKYPITEIGVLNLIDKLVEVGEKDVKYGECNVEYTEGVKMGDRECTMIKVTHPVPRKNFRFHIARVFVDNELNLPIRYDSFDWPTKEGEEPIVLEVYTYQKLQLNVGLTDEDFSTKNSKYDFSK
ncbi:MAG: DUF1571 domain-containing protein [Thermoguttaceae bacterium]